jgi:anti-sigma regulatory factor (Ser/Thr protein kinase)
MSTISCPAAAMLAEDTAKPASRLTLKSQLDDMALLWPWIEALAVEYAIPADTVFGVHLCLEEAISNVIRHGYDGQPGNRITVDCASPSAHEVVFTIEDQAAPFDPVSGSLIEDQPATSPMDYLRPGGRGILLMRKFADTLAYERLASGNRLTIGFFLPQ